ncbi:S24 family peptidase [Hoylesella nanceiensis]|uniref:S24 family peptidase n=1 Tax=Hoylesella nanceiensis TaxID=425941 RepID=UPI00241D4AF3|nr:S24 family peptidase [Hoylesella nanceiensis]
MKIKGLSDNKVTIDLDFSVGTLNKSRKENRDLSSKNIDKILNFYQDINKVWLLTGEGEMLKTNTQDDQIKEIPLEEAHNYPEGSLIPYFGETQTKGGLDNYQIPTDIVEYPTSMIKAGDIFIKATSAIKHIGESMAEYPSGCVLFCRQVEDMSLLVNGSIYVIETSEYRVTKKIYNLEDAIRAYSTNTETYPDGALVYAPFDIPKSKIMRMHKVLGYSCKVE